ncbi:DUF11 domain-containing protein [Luteimicrobium xylanilyticum]|uniref:DUF7507 domain-containing protein n=1 Tax=Luteimicrobium xylanilyticum TaxID=1133546 RepID=UPI00056492B4
MTGRRRLVRTWATGAVVALVMSSAVAVSGAGPASADPPTGGSTIVDETFTNPTVPDDAWQPLGDACLTGMASDAPTPTTGSPLPSCSAHQVGGSDYWGTGDQQAPPMGADAGDGFLQLTDSGGFRTGGILYNRPIPATAGISVTFQQWQYARSGPEGGDGIGFFLVDGSTDLTDTGSDGGSMGYAQRNLDPGIEGGVVGVGLDVYGNFFNDSESRGLGCPDNQVSPVGTSGTRGINTITVRGPGSGTTGYCFQGSTASDSGASTLAGNLEGSGYTEDQARTVNVQVTPSDSPGGSRVIVQVRYADGGPWTTELDVPAPSNLPGTYKFGFSASTGGSTNVHLVRNVVVQTIDPLEDLQLVKQVDRTNGALPPDVGAGDTIPYQYTITNTGSTTLHGVTVDDDNVDGTVTCPDVDVPPAPDPAATITCTGTHVVTAAEASAGHVDNTATATALDPGNGTVTSNESSVTVPLHSAVRVEKSVTSDPPYLVGQSVQYAYVVTNTGDSDLVNVALADDRIANTDLSCPQNTLAPDASMTCTGTYTVQAGDVAPSGSVTNTATVTAQTPIGQQVTDTDTASIGVNTDVGVTKSVNDSTPDVGANVTFTVRATNHGPGVATGVVVTDQLPDRLTYVSSNPSQGTYDPATGEWTVGTLGTAGASSTATLTLTARVTSNGSITNTAARTAMDQVDTDTTNDRASVTITARAIADIAVTKRVDGDATIARGTEGTFVVTARNDGPSDATGVTIHDALPAGLAFVSASGDGSYDAATGTWTVGALANGDDASLRMTVRGDTNGRYTNVAARADSSPDDPNSANDADTATLVVVDPTADLSVTKTVDPTAVQVGDTVTYRVTVHNAGPDPADGVVMTDDPPTGMTVVSIGTPSQGEVSDDAGTWTVGHLDSGASATVEVTAQVDTAGTKTNTVTVSAPDVSDPNPDNNTDSATLVSSEPPLDIAVGKSVTTPEGVSHSAVPLGTTMTYTLTATNQPASDGTETDATGLLLRDRLPAGVTYVSSDDCDGTYTPGTGVWDVGELASGDTATCQVVVTADTAGLQVNSVALDSVDQRDTNPTNNQAIAAVVVVRLADLGITKTVDPTTAQPGDTVTYTITVTNHGPNTAHDVTAVDPMPIAADIEDVNASQGTFDRASRVWSIGTLDDGEHATLTVTVLLDQRTGTFVNTVAIGQSDAYDPEPDNDTAQARLFVPAADIEVTKTVDDATPAVGDEVTFTVGVTNWGPDPARDVTVDDVLPAGLDYVSSSASAGSYDPSTGVWDVGTLAPVTLPRAPRAGPAERLVITARVTETGTTTNEASSDRDGAYPYDPDLDNNAASATVTATPAPANVAIDKSVRPGTVTAGSTVTYTIRITQDGPGAAEDVHVSDTFPEGVVPRAVTGTDGCDVDGQDVSCDLGTLAAGASTTLTVTADATAVGTHVNTATVSTTSEQTSTADDTASATLRVTPRPTPTPTPTPTQSTPVPTTPGPSPTAGPSSPGAHETPPPSSGGGLAATGADVLTVAVVVVVLLLVGLGLMVLSRRRRRGED